MMVPLRCCSFNCRGWNNGKLTLKIFIDSIDLCFLQEYWLLDDYLNDVREISSDFTSVDVSGVNSCDLLSHGRPYGSCSILYRKSLSTSICFVDACSDRFCSVKLCDSSGLSYLLVCVYMPTSYTSNKLLDDFMVELNLYACDLDFRSSVKYTYESNNCLAHSWLDHIIRSRDISHLISNIHTVHSGSNSSDHFPLFFHGLTSCVCLFLLPIQYP